MKHLKYFFAILILSFSYSCSVDEGEVELRPKTMLDLVQESTNYTYLTYAISKTGLSNTLSSNNANLTLFAPDDMAFGRFLMQNGFRSIDEIPVDLLKKVLLNNTSRFDRNWDSKERYSMDWYYPILSGAFSKSDSIELIRDKWNEFVVEGLGCKCVKEEPWVTAAESAELVLALTKIGLKNEAEKILQDTFNLIDDDGLLWTGYVFKDKKYWPIEKPSWTMGAAILAGNAINKFSPSSDFFEF